MKVIGVCGYKRSGKDTVAQILVKDYKYTRFALADPMKEVLAKIFMWDDEWMNGIHKEEIDGRWGISPRQALQHLGTEWGQYALCEQFPVFKAVTGRSLWVKRVYEEISSSVFEKIVIPDIRFPHEVEYLKIQYGLEFTMIRVDRTGVREEDQHESERFAQELPVDVVIDNDSTFTRLRVQVFNLQP